MGQDIISYGCLITLYSASEKNLASASTYTTDSLPSAMAGSSVEILRATLERKRMMETGLLEKHPFGRSHSNNLFISTNRQPDDIRFSTRAKSLAVQMTTWVNKTLGPGRME
jgi:hypothetical protein